MKIIIDRRFGKRILVDDEDYEYLSKYVWSAYESGRTFYAKRYLWENGKVTAIFMHRVIMNASKGIQIDHIDGNGLNNQKSNLRFVTYLQNHANRGLHNSSHSGYKGVCWNKRAEKWQTHIRFNKKQIHLGYFPTKEEAAEAYNKAALQYFEEYARLNVIK